MIPKIAHVIWLGDWDVRVDRSIQRFFRHHPDWSVTVSTGMSESHPLYSLYARGRYPAARANILRVALLDALGGLYFDPDIVWNGRLPELDPAYFWVSDDTRPFVNNCLLSCVPGHPALKAYIQTLVSWADSFGSRVPSQECTGPRCLTEVAKSRHDIRAIPVSRKISGNAPIIHQCWGTGVKQGAGYDPEPTR